MKEWMYHLLLLAFVCIAIYLFYRFGVVKRIRAVLFVFLPGKNGDRADLNACTGWVRRVSRFKESGTYAFVFDARLSKGEAEVLLLDKKGQTLLKLNRQLPSQTIDLDRKSRYYLRWEFKSATGKCELRWSNS